MTRTNPPGTNAAFLAGAAMFTVLLLAAAVPARAAGSNEASLDALAGRPSSRFT